MLDHQPVVLGGVGLAGSIGWYDYSFADESLGIPEAFYEAKIAPGAAAYLGRQGLLEAHRHYLDVQYVAQGREVMGYAPLENLTIETPYDANKDCELFQIAKNTSLLRFEQGMFGIFYPQDAHLPGRHLDAAESVCKVVVKVRI